MRIEYLVNINGQRTSVKFDENDELIINNKKINYELTRIDQKQYNLKFENKVYEIFCNHLDNAKLDLLIDGHQLETITRTALQEKAFRLLEESRSTSHHHLEVIAPMPGIILKIKKRLGEKVKRGDSVLILEAMKMENEINAPSSGVITKLDVSEGKAVEKNAFLFTIG